MDSYSDPTDTVILEKIKQELTKAKTIGEMKDILTRVYPDFIVGFIQEFSLDYPTLTWSWRRLCQYSGVNPTQIMIVNNWNRSDKNHTIVEIVIASFIASGFVVRQVSEVQACMVCGKGIATEQYYQVLKDKGASPLPTRWSPACSACYGKLIK